MSNLREKIVILGGGISGLSCSYHFNHKNTLIIEKEEALGGHIRTHKVDGALWDEGPHVSFTKHNYVRKLFEKSVEDNYSEFSANISNINKDYWIPHPAQSNLHALPKEIATACLDDFIKTRNHLKTKSAEKPNNYSEWLVNAFGNKFAENFPFNYTKKYWTCDPSSLSTDWIGERIFYPNENDIKEGYHKPLSRNTHYINSFRYPSKGGFSEYINLFSQGANVINARVLSIDLSEKIIRLENKQTISYEYLVNTIPLNVKQTFFLFWGEKKNVLCLFLVG